MQHTKTEKWVTCDICGARQDGPYAWDVKERDPVWIGIRRNVYYSQPEMWNDICYECNAAILRLINERRSDKKAKESIA